MELDTPVIFSDYIRPICLPAAQHDFPSGNTVWITGWGAKREGGGLKLTLCLEFHSTLSSIYTANILISALTHNKADLCVITKREEVSILSFFSKGFNIVVIGVVSVLILILISHFSRVAVASPGCHTDNLLL